MAGKESQEVSESEPPLANSAGDQNPQTEPLPWYRRIHAVQLVLAAILLVGGAVRAWQLDFGLPYALHPDEPICVKLVQQLLKENFWLPGYQHPPLLKLLATLGLALRNLFSPIPPAALETDTFLALRLVSLVSAILTILVVYLLAREFVQPRWSLVAAGLYAVLPITVFHARYGVPDPLLSLLFCTALWLQTLLLRKPKLWLYAVNGLVLSLAVAAKYSAGLLFLSLALAHLLANSSERPRWRAWLSPTRLTATAAGGLLGLLAGFPMALSGASLRLLLTSVGKERAHLFHSGHGGIVSEGRGLTGVYYLVRSLLPAAGAPLSLAIVGGLLCWFFPGPKARWIVVAAVLPYYLLIESLLKVPPSPDRYVLPLVAPLLVGAVLIAERAERLILRRWGPRVPTLLAVALLTAAFPVYKTTRLLLTLRPDTRLQARAWMDANIPRNAVVQHQWTVEAHYPPKQGAAYRSRLLSDRSILDGRPPLSTGDYVLASSFIYRRYFDNPRDRPELTRFYQRLFAEGELLAQFGPAYQSYLFHNPHIAIYRWKGPDLRSLGSDRQTVDQAHSHLPVRSLGSSDTSTEETPTP